MSTNNHNNINRRDNDSEHHFYREESSSMYTPEFMDAEDSLLEVRSSLNKTERAEVLQEKLTDKVNYYWNHSAFY